MKRKLIITCAVLVLFSVALLAVQSYRVHSILNKREVVIKEALRTADDDLPQSNAPNGAERFIETGELVFKWSYLKNPSDLGQHTMFNIRVYPRVSTHRSDGWVGIHRNRWYVKIL